MTDAGAQERESRSRICEDQNCELPHDTAGHAEGLRREHAMPAEPSAPKCTNPSGKLIVSYYDHKPAERYYHCYDCGTLLFARTDTEKQSGAS